MSLVRARLKPVDMTVIQDEIRKTLGMASSLTIGADELGFTMTFSHTSDPEIETTDTANVNGDVGDVKLRCADDDFGSALLIELRRLAGLPTQLSDMLNQSDTAVTVNVDTSTALLVMKRPAGKDSLQPGSEERFAIVLQLRASSREISVDQEFFVDDVSVAVPQRIPKELDRRDVLRLDMLGEGFSGEVRRVV
jgi:hypothetical protein